MIEINCSNNSNKLGIKYWRKGICEERKHIDNDDILQIKQSVSYNYIYCSFLNITIYNKEVPCPEDVFLLPSNISFKVGGFSYKAQQAAHHSEFHFVPSWVYRVNHHLDPLMRQNIYESYIKEINESLSHITDSSDNDNINIMNDQSINIALVFSVIILMSVLIFMAYLLKQRFTYESRSQNINVELQETPREETETRKEVSQTKRKGKILIRMKPSSSSD